MPDREKVIKGLAEMANSKRLWNKADYWAMVCRDALELLKEQEAVEPKTGHWIESKCLDECFWVCSECNFPSEAIAAPQLYKYCPNCGTKMAEGR